MNRVRSRLDRKSANTPVSLEEGPERGLTAYDQRELRRMSDQLTHLLETLEAGEDRRSSPAVEGARSRFTSVMRQTGPCDLSDRQMEILSRVAEGMSNKEIAAELHVSDQTIKNHMTHILDRLYANDRTHAVVLAYRLGLLDLEVGDIGN